MEEGELFISYASSDPEVITLDLNGEPTLVTSSSVRGTLVYQGEYIDGMPLVGFPYGSVFTVKGSNTWADGSFLLWTDQLTSMNSSDFAFQIQTHARTLANQELGHIELASFGRGNGVPFLLGGRIHPLFLKPFGLDLRVPAGLIKRGDSIRQVFPEYVWDDVSPTTTSLVQWGEGLAYTTGDGVDLQPEKVLRRRGVIIGSVYFDEFDLFGNFIKSKGLLVDEAGVIGTGAFYREYEPMLAKQNNIIQYGQAQYAQLPYTFVATAITEGSGENYAISPDTSHILLPVENYSVAFPKDQTWGDRPFDKFRVPSNNYGVFVSSPIPLKEASSKVLIFIETQLLGEAGATLQVEVIIGEETFVILDRNHFFKKPITFLRKDFDRCRDSFSIKVAASSTHSLTTFKIQISYVVL